MRIFKILAGFLCCFSATAATLNVTFTNPVANTDGSAIPATGPGSLTGTRVEYGSCVGAAFGVAVGEQVVTGTSASFLNVGPGTYCVRAFARNTYGNESAASNVSSKVVPAPVPNPPTLVVAVVAGINMSPVYRINADGSRGTAVLGHVPVDTGCNGAVVYTYRSRSYRRVDPAYVKWDHTSPTPNVAAPCA